MRLYTHCFDVTRLRDAYGTMPGNNCTKRAQGTNLSMRHERVITKRIVDGLAVEGKDALFWDRDLPGFGVRVYPSGVKVYVVQSRGPGGSRRVTVGRHGDMAADQARRRAADMIDRIKRGADPAPPAPAPEVTMADLAERYMRQHVTVHCKPSSAKAYRRALDNHILPALGEMPIGAVGRKHVGALHYKMRGEPCAANEALKIVAKMLSLAEDWGLRERGPNPCKSVRKYRTRPRERFLTDAEFERLGLALEEMEAGGAIQPSAAAAIRLLVLTGCRRNEILELRWDDVDLASGELRLRDSKTGARMVPLTPVVNDVLAGIPRAVDNPWVITGKKPGARLTDINRPWRALRSRAGLKGVRIHDLRHSWASRALELGESLPMIGRLLGHSRIETTARYAHLARDTEKASAAKVGGSIGSDILPMDEPVARVIRKQRQSDNGDLEDASWPS